MNIPTQPRRLFARALPRLAGGLAGLALLVALSALVGWLGSWPWLTSFGTGLTPMAPSTTACIILLGLVLALRQQRPGYRRLRRADQIIAGLVLVWSLFILLRFLLAYWGRLPLDLEQWLAPPSQMAQGSHPIRMSPITALLLALLALAIWLSRPRRAFHHLRSYTLAVLYTAAVFYTAAQGAALFSLILSGIILVGYWFAAPFLYGNPITPVALNPSICIILLSASLLLDSQHAWIAHWILDDSIYSRFTRLLIPSVVLVILLVGWIHMLVLENLSPVYEVVSFSLSALLSAVLIGLITIFAARQIQAQVNHAHQALKTSQDFTSLLASSLPAYVAYVGAEDLRYRYANPLYERNFNRPRIIGLSVREVLGEANFQFALPYIEKALAGQRATYINTFQFVGGQSWLEVSFVPDFDEQRAVRGIVVLSYDITESKRAEQALSAATTKLETLIQSSPLAIVMLDTQQLVQLWNPSAEKLFGWEAAEVLGKPNPAVPPDRREAYHEWLQRTDQERIMIDHETLWQHKNGSVITVSIWSAPLRDAAGHLLGDMGIIADITERKQAEQQIKTALAEKETLLRELYHRTNNNMQVICSLLDLQASYTDEPYLLNAFASTNNRIRAMALVHQKLYDAQDLSHINLKEYIADLFKLLVTRPAVPPRQQVPPNQFTLVSELEDVFVLIDTAIPCGLILDELISNTIQHAYPSGQKGIITIELRRQEDGEICLCYADDGVGTPPGFDFRQDAHLGLQNVFTLAESQLRGQVSFENKPGVYCRLTFYDNLYQPRI